MKNEFMVSLFLLIKNSSFSGVLMSVFVFAGSHFTLFSDILLKKINKKINWLIYNESSSGTTFACPGRSATSDSVWVDGLAETSSVLWIDSPIAVKKSSKVHDVLSLTANIYSGTYVKSSVVCLDEEVCVRVCVYMYLCVCVCVCVCVCGCLTPFHYPLNAGAVSMATLTPGSQCYFFHTSSLFRNLSLSLSLSLSLYLSLSLSLVRSSILPSHSVYPSLYLSVSFSFFSLSTLSLSPLFLSLHYVAKEIKEKKKTSSLLTCSGYLGSFNLRPSHTVYSTSERLSVFSLCLFLSPVLLEDASEKQLLTKSFSAPTLPLNSSLERCVHRVTVVCMTTERLFITNFRRIILLHFLVGLCILNSRGVVVMHV